MNPVGPSKDSPVEDSSVDDSSALQNASAASSSAENATANSALFTVRWWLTNPELGLAMLILVGFLVLSTLQVISRFVLTLPFTWTEELTAALVIWMTFLGAIAVQRNDSHIRVEMIREFLPPKAVAIVYGIFDLAILGCLVAMAAGGWHTLQETAYQKTPALGIPLNLITAAVPIASVPLAVFVIRNALRRFRTER